MWFAKLFGGGRDNEVDDEPARFPSMPVAQPAQSTPPLKSATNARSVAAKAVKGFDPYNSGAFRRQNAWERVSRR
jgi:hypothetical protein